MFVETSLEPFDNWSLKCTIPSTALLNNVRTTWGEEFQSVPRVEGQQPTNVSKEEMKMQQMLQMCE